jgi:hypothetical protein
MIIEDSATHEHNEKSKIRMVIIAAADGRTG